MQTYLKHVVKERERWDNLAYFYYGDPLLINLLIDANPHIAFCEELPVGYEILVPVLAAKEVNNDGLPPWMEAS